MSLYGIAAAALAFTALIGGWFGRGWYEDSQELAETNQALERLVEVEGERDKERTKNSQLRTKLARVRVAPKPPECDATPEQLRIVNEALRGPVPETTVAGERRAGPPS